MGMTALQTILAQLHREARRLAADVKTVAAVTKLLEGQQRAGQRRRVLAVARRGRGRRVTAKQRAAISIRMRRYWAGKRRQKAAA